MLSGTFRPSCHVGEVHQPLMPSGAVIIMTSCRYPNTTKKVVEGASLAVTLNSRVAVIGANGAGKSTLIKVLTGESLLTWCGGVLPTVPACLGHYTFPQAQYAFLASKPASAASPTSWPVPCLYICQHDGM